VLSAPTEPISLIVERYVEFKISTNSLPALLISPPGRGTEIPIVNITSLFGRKEICVQHGFDIIEQFIIEATCLVLLAWTCWEIIKKKTGL
jgi:hypothetical protein